MVADNPFRVVKLTTELLGKITSLVEYDPETTPEDVQEALHAVVAMVDVALDSPDVAAARAAGLEDRAELAEIAEEMAEERGLQWPPEGARESETPPPAAEEQPTPEETPPA